MIELKNIKLEQINYNNKNHLIYMKKLMQSKDINYLWDLTDDELLNNHNVHKYIVINNDNNPIGYINISDETEAMYGNTVSIYYAVGEEHRGKNYGKKIIEEVREWLFKEKNIDCIVAQVDNQNNHSKNTLNKAGMLEVMQDDEYTTFIQRKIG
jgi:RimJ/RimL family protein N-acetyltransferase